MSLIIVWLWLFTVLSLVNAENDTIEISSCSEVNFQYDFDAGTNKTINITEVCSEKPCIAKCCPHNQVLYLNETGLGCGDVIYTTYDYLGVQIYDQYKRKSKKTMKQFTHIYSELFTDPVCSYNISEVYSSPENEPYILENGTLAIRQLNFVNQWDTTVPTDQFCVEYEVVSDGRNITSKQLVIRLILHDVTEEEKQQLSDAKNIFASYGMLVSCVFLLLVLAVYSLLPQLRNLAGMMLMAYVTTLTIAFIFRAVLVNGSEHDILDTTACLIVGFIFYYTILASFTWMNVMSFDIWWSMRGFRKLRQIHRRGILVKFGWYSLYGWGAPLIPVLFIIIVDNMDLSSTPGFIKPHISNQCFMAEDERQLYMNGPILITTCINMTLFLMTAYNIWRIKSDVTQHSAGESRRNKKDELRFIIYLKLSLVMGINWILEVLSSLDNTNSVWWNIPDIFNCLSGVFIFIIFVCKRNVIALLCKRFSIETKFMGRWQPGDSSRTDSSRVTSRRKMQESFTTDTSDVEDSEKRGLASLDKIGRWKRSEEKGEFI